MRNVEDVYPLSPLQQALLFHVLSAPESGAGFEQSRCILAGELDPPIFERAWQRIVDRHPILRTAFFSEGLKEPVQVVRKQVTLPFEHADWRGLEGGEQQERMAAYLAEDQRRGFDPTRAPLMRLGLFRLADDQHFFVWSHHHLLLDGWCTALLLKELLILYDAFQRGEEPRLPASRPFRDYIAWLQRQDRAAAEAFWRRMFAGFMGPTPLVVDRLPRDPSSGAAFGQHTAQLPLAATLDLQRLAERAGITMSTLVQGAWALLLSRYNGKPEVVFGTTVSGRPAGLAGVETMIGIFINNLPVRTQIPPSAGAASWLRDLQEILLDLRQLEYSSPVQVLSWSGWTGGERLFETLVLFQNYPTGEITEDLSARRLEIRSQGSRLETNYPLTLLAAPRQVLLLQLHYDARRFDPATTARMLGHLRALLASFATSPDRPAADLEILTPGEMHQILLEWSDPSVGISPGPLDPPWAELTARTGSMTGQTGIHVLDRDGRALPVGILGEVCLDGAALHRMGELGRRLPNGRIELLGAPVTADAGTRELAEIETVLRRSPEILDVAVCSRGLEGRRVAYLRVGPSHRFDAMAARRLVLSGLPGVAPPAEFVFLDTFPRTLDRRIDREALPAPEEVSGGREGTVAPPRTVRELRLVQIWERLFGRHPIGVTDSFFDLGGHSLLAVRLMAEIREQFGREVPAARLLQEPTIERLARALDENLQPAPWSPLMAIQPQGSRPPFFCVHPAGGSALRYVSLAYHLGTDHPVYGLQARGHERGQEPFNRIEEMAAFYCEAVTAVQPHGPYFLGGWSFGGLVAFEMARQLQGRGEEVGLLALFDAAAGNVAWDRYTGPTPDRAERLAGLLREDLPVSVEELRQLESADEQVEHIVRQAQRHGLLPPGFDLDQARRYVATLEAHGEALRAYRSEPFTGRLVLFCATEGLVTALGDPRLGWEGLAVGGVEVHMIPGRHQDLFQAPQVQTLAERLRAYWS